MEFILMLLVTIFIFGFMAALVMVQIPLAYYLEEKWIRMKNRGTKVFFLACVLTGFGLYPFVAGSLTTGSGRGDKPSRGEVKWEGGAPASQGRILAVDAKDSRFNQRESQSWRTSVDENNRVHTNGSSNTYDWTLIAKRYLRGGNLHHTLVLQLNRLSRMDLEKLNDKDWQNLRKKLKHDPVLKK